MEFGFEERRSVGEMYARDLDRLFDPEFRIIPVDMVWERLGVDRFFHRRKDSTRIAVEYKADVVACRTGNLFFETISTLYPDGRAKHGWTKKSLAQWVVFYLPERFQVFVFDMGTLKLRLPEWVARYPEKSVQNKGYVTRGIAVPLKEIRHLAIEQRWCGGKCA